MARKTKTTESYKACLIRQFAKATGYSIEAATKEFAGLKYSDIQEHVYVATGQAEP